MLSLIIYFIFAYKKLTLFT